VTNHIEDDDICVDVLRIDRNRRNQLQLSGEPFGIGVILFEPIDMVFESINAGGCQDAGLPHRATVHAAKASRLFDPSQIIGY